MKFLKNKKMPVSEMLKLAGLALLVLIILGIVFNFLGAVFNSFNRSYSDSALLNSSRSFYSNSDGVATLSVETESFKSLDESFPSIKKTDEESFEVTEYNASIETRRLQKTCNKVVELKEREDVIFQNSNEAEKYCNYSFKVEHKSVEEVLAIIEDLNPRKVNRHIYTIKKAIDNNTSELKILQNNLTSIQETLTDAISSYDDITELSTRAQNLEALATIIDSKVNVINRLTKEKIRLNSQIERLLTTQQEHIDRLKYTYFNVNVNEFKFIDIANIKDSWKSSIQSLVININNITQEITVGLINILFYLVQVIVYLFITLIVVKHGWRIVKHVWNR